MKTIILIFTMAVLVTACGQGGGGAGKGTTTKTISALLNNEESKLVTNLIDLKEVEEKVLLKEMMKLSNFDENTITKLEAHINVECALGICQITENNLTPMATEQ